MSSHTVRRSLAAFATALLLIALGSATVRPAAAQTAVSADAGIVATGIGRASAPATSASVQIIVSRDIYGGFVEVMPGFGMGESADATPVAGEGESGTTDSGEPGMMPGDMGMMPSPLTEADLTPITDAITAAGVPADQISVLMPGSFSSYTGIGGPLAAELRFTIDNPVTEDLTVLATSVQQAALDAGLSLQHIGVSYSGEDCAGLAQQAREAAVADAQQRAEGLATALGIELGDLVQAADGSFSFGPASLDPTACISQTGMFESFGPGIEPPFNPMQPAEIVIVATVTLTYAIGSAEPTA